MEKELRFQDVFYLENNQILDAEKWLQDDEMVGLVDEEAGGIIGYIHQEHIEKILNLLNKFFSIFLNE